MKRSEIRLRLIESITCGRPDASHVHVMETALKYEEFILRGNPADEKAVRKFKFSRPAFMKRTSRKAPKTA